MLLHRSCTAVLPTTGKQPAECVAPITKSVSQISFVTEDFSIMGYDTVAARVLLDVSKDHSASIFRAKQSKNYLALKMEALLVF
jgi:hypothetical protein